MGSLGGNFSTFFNTPKFMADGGLAYGPTFAMIGEGKYKEAVLPLNESTFSSIGKGISEHNGGNHTIVINAPLDGRRAIGDYFAKNGEVIAEALGRSAGIAVDYGGALT